MSYDPKHPPKPQDHYTPYDDLVARLRDNPWHVDCYADAKLGEQAADEIERLCAEADERRQTIAALVSQRDGIDYRARDAQARAEQAEARLADANTQLALMTMAKHNAEARLARVREIVDARATHPGSLASIILALLDGEEK